MPPANSWRDPEVSGLVTKTTTSKMDLSIFLNLRLYKVLICNTTARVSVLHRTVVSSLRLVTLSMFLSSVLGLVHVATFFDAPRHIGVQIVAYASLIHARFACWLSC